MEGRRVERKGVLKVVAWRRVESTAMIARYCLGMNIRKCLRKNSVGTRLYFVPYHLTYPYNRSQGSQGPSKAKYLIDNGTSTNFDTQLLTHERNTK